MACGGTATVTDEGEAGADADSSTDEDGGEDAARDATVDARSDGPIDASADGAADATLDAAPDASVDSPFDAMVDVVEDVVVDAISDGPSEGASDAALEADVGSSTDADLDAPDDAAADVTDVADVAIEAGPDAAAGGPALLVMASSLSENVYVGAYQNGVWSSFSDLGHGSAAGIAALPDGRAVGLAIWGAPPIESTTWSLGTWSGFNALPTTHLVSEIGMPIANPTGAYAVLDYGLPDNTISLDTFDDATSTWSTDMTIINAYGTFPAVALDANDDPVVVYLQTLGSTAYAWTTRHGGVWTYPVSIPGLPSGPSGGHTTFDPGVLAANRVGVDEIVCVFVTGTTAAGGMTLAASSLIGGAWSSPTPLASDALGYGDGISASAIALPDGRVALAYLNTASAVAVGFYDGTSWGQFATIPNVTLTYSAGPLPLAPGLPGAVLELAYVGAGRDIEHTRLIDEATWTWAAPDVVDATQSYNGISITTRP